MELLSRLEGNEFVSWLYSYEADAHDVLLSFGSIHVHVASSSVYTTVESEQPSNAHRRYCLCGRSQDLHAGHIPAPPVPFASSHKSNGVLVVAWILEDVPAQEGIMTPTLRSSPVLQS